MSAYLNALMEEGTRGELLFEVKRNWEESRKRRKRAETAEAERDWLAARVDELLAILQEIVDADDDGIKAMRAMGLKPSSYSMDLSERTRQALVIASLYKIRR